MMFDSINRYIKVLKVPGNGNFPYCTCVLFDDEMKVLMDSSCGSDLAARLKAHGLDVLLHTHMHLDHTGNTGELGPVQLWCHGLDAPGIRSVQTYLDMYGFHMFEGEELGRKLAEHFGLQSRTVDREIIDEELLDFGHIKLRVIHTPGHTPGHCSFYDEENDILFSADIDLGPLGPFYAHLCSDIDDLLGSIQRCMDLKPAMVIAGHNGLVKGDLNARFLSYRDKVLTREEKIYQSIKAPRSLDDLADEHNFLIPRLEFAYYQKYFNKHGVLKHLERLIKMGRLASEDGLYYRS
ncbi:MAG: MBL fold metallo-hydrolase [Syntrophomonadaceae bacterium]